MVRAKCIYEGDILLSGLTVPPLVKKRGRPKGHGLTTIGLPAKRARKELLRYKKPCSFSKLHVSEKEKGNIMSIVLRALFYVLAMLFAFIQ